MLKITKERVRQLEAKGTHLLGQLLGYDEDEMPYVPPTEDDDQWPENGERKKCHPLPVSA
jgi:hypothetical protein